MDQRILQKILLAGASIAALSQRDLRGVSVVVEPSLPAETDPSGAQRSELTRLAPDSPLNPSETNHG